MNLPNKLSGVFFTLGLGLLLTGCESMFHDDLESCPQAVYVKLYGVTCKEDSVSLGTQSNVHLFAFDENNKLAAATEVKDFDLGNRQTGFKEIKLPIVNNTPDRDRAYNIYAWTGLNGKFKVNFHPDSLHRMIGTPLSEVLARLNTDAESNYARLGNDRVFAGMSGHSVTLLNPAENATQEKHIAVPVGEKTYRLKVSVILDKSVRQRIDPPSIREFGVAISSANGSLTYTGDTPSNAPVANYVTNGPVVYGDTALVANYTLLDLSHTGLKSSIRLTHQSAKSNADVEMPAEIQNDLVAAILNYTSNPANKFSFNLNCEHDIDLKLVVKDKCVECGTYACAGILINDWQVHSFDIEFGK